MKGLLILLTILFGYQKVIGEESMVEIRNLYEQAALSKTANLKLIKMLADVNETNALLTGYKGAAIMMEANHLINPISKLNRFSAGKKLIEQAIAKGNNQAELRYIRLTIQTNLPKFLGYNDAIDKDKKILIKSLATEKDTDLKNRIIAYLTTKNICNADELEEINVWKNK